MPFREGLCGQHSGWMAGLWQVHCLVLIRCQVTTSPCSPPLEHEIEYLHHFTREQNAWRIPQWVHYFEPLHFSSIMEKK